MKKEKLIEKAVEYKKTGCNCCQAVVKAFLGNNKRLMSIASGFGAGMGCMKATCGALVGANIVLSRKGMGRYARVLHARFEELTGASICGDIKGKNTGVVLTPCEDCVRNAAIALTEILYGK